jgi:hypothetical protein
MTVEKYWTLYRMHFRPHGLKRFQMAFQNNVFRVYRLIEDGVPALEQPANYSPLFDESLFNRLEFSTPPEIPKEEAFLYTVVSAYSDLWHSEQLMKKGLKQEAFKLLLRSVETFPYIPQTHAALAGYYASVGRPEKAKMHKRKADALNAIRLGGINRKGSAK